jgi:uncharacterized protein (AIM24 family)
MTTGERFDRESERILRVDVDGGVWIKPGAAIAYRGDLKFERLATLQAPRLVDAAFREITPLVRAVGRGRLYCGRRGSHVHIRHLAGESLVVNCDDLLAFEESLSFETKVVGHGLGIAAGGLIVMTLSGQGSLAIAAHGEILKLPATPESPVCTDPHATLAWSADLTPELKTDLGWRSIIGHGGQEPVQMLFNGYGDVFVQPFEGESRLMRTMQRKPMWLDEVSIGWG